jgi:hypothetical protein
VAELRKVASPTSRAQRNVWRLVALVLAAILVAVLKPWGDGSPAPIGGVASAAPSATASPDSVAVRNGRVADFLTFGTNEPPPGWELWPAGNLASFYFAMRIDMAPRATPGPSGSLAPAPTSTAAGVDQPATVPDQWPTIDIPAGSTLDLLGINHPVEYRITMVAFEQLDAIPGHPVRGVLATSPWPTHFTIIGVSTDASDTIRAWPVGRYRLEVRIDPGGVRRSVEIVVQPTPLRSPAPSG